MSIPLTVTATLDTATSGVEGEPLMLDGPLAWAYAVTAPPGSLPPITSSHAEDMPLPLARWERHSTWGWCVSRAHWTQITHSQTEVRRKPSDQQFARFTRDGRNHHGLGPHKARDTVVPVALIPTIWWDLDCTDETELRRLLHSVTHLGAHRAIGLGHVARWDIQPGTEGAWEDRPMPAPGLTGRYRPPYWHHTREVATL